MNPKSILFDLYRKGWTAEAIHDNLVATLGEEAIAYSPVTNYLREARIRRSEIVGPSGEQPQKIVIILFYAHDPKVAHPIIIYFRDRQMPDSPAGLLHPNELWPVAPDVTKA
jgi:hypothetical protein